MTFIMNGSIRRKTMNDKTYRIAPKGLAYLAMMEADLLDSYDDIKFKKFWDIFKNRMKKYEYINEEDWY